MKNEPYTTATSAPLPPPLATAALGAAAGAAAGADALPSVPSAPAVSLPTVVVTSSSHSRMSTFSPCTSTAAPAPPLYVIVIGAAPLFCGIVMVVVAPLPPVTAGAGF